MAVAFYRARRTPTSATRRNPSRRSSARHSAASQPPLRQNPQDRSCPGADFFASSPLAAIIQRNANAASLRARSRTKAKIRRPAIKRSVFCGVSVDGFLARRDDTFDFLNAGEGVPHGFTKFLASVDVVVLGRRTFDVVMKLTHLPLYGKKHIVVLSHRPLEFPPVKDGAPERMSGEPAEIVKQLESRGFKHAYIDGGINIQRFLAAGLINRLIVTRVPVLIGTGIPLFGPVPRDIALRHVATRTYGGGLVQSEYEIRDATPAGGRKGRRRKAR